MSAPAPHVLTVEDNPGLAELLREYLGAHGLRITGVSDGPGGLHAALHHAPDVVLLDVMLPGLGGLEVLRRLRLESDVPVLMLTARDGEADKVLALELGADDYLTKPFSMAELLARVRALLRRAAPAAPRGPLRHGPLTLDAHTRDVTVRGEPVKLTRVEFELLHVLLLSPRRVFTRSELLGHVQEDGGGSERTIDVHVRNLRAKLERDPARPELLETVYGVGYRLGDVP
ncbi:DNA-binding response OmpR family regulator [Deinococcus metalli]|uniref:DNA-binding response OmpR family regulator n=1 Tax=Deinococcus metalli TaxID=1141878 RepID=A0A7W8KJR4_9DEIO|nr:response regulator transcription factor [Deinococcus metalli]MBB5378428.1 DNA-binding response OmpR family regulator [Deinococcus metalli]GHF59047.1 DNA-binding response regulator [Deinococcus metalli]